MLLDSGSSALLLTALVVGISHTLMGPDHYLPFVALSKARGWSLRRTMGITLLCGIGHVLGSVLLGAIGLAAGWSLGSLESIESVRGSVAAWLLTALGLIYLAWALKGLGRNQRHTHIHAHADGTVHTHEHTHHKDHAHAHTEAGKRSITAWSLFVIFVFGPCEAFIPILLFPAVTQDAGLAVATTLVFAGSTLATMAGAVYLGTKGVESLPLNKLGPYGHVAAGCAILLCAGFIHLGF
jgi:ABC-type nickel/cobalt efflux system permease component RcnA